MKNIIWGNLIQNIIRCIIAYPLFLIALVISIPFNVFGWFIWIFEIVTAFAQFIFTGEFYLIRYSTIWDLVIYHSFRELMFTLFPATLWIYEKIIDFNKSLVKYDLVDIYDKYIEEIKRS